MLGIIVFADSDPHNTFESILNASSISSVIDLNLILCGDIKAFKSHEGSLFETIVPDISIAFEFLGRDCTRVCILDSRMVVTPRWLERQYDSVHTNEILISPVKVLERDFNTYEYIVKRGDKDIDGSSHTVGSYNISFPAQFIDVRNPNFLPTKSVYFIRNDWTEMDAYKYEAVVVLPNEFAIYRTSTDFLVMSAKEYLDLRA